MFELDGVPRRRSPREALRAGRRQAADQDPLRRPRRQRGLRMKAHEGRAICAPRRTDELKDAARQPAQGSSSTCASSGPAASSRRRRRVRQVRRDIARIKTVLGEKRAPRLRSTEQMPKRVLRGRRRQRQDGQDHRREGRAPRSCTRSTRSSSAARRSITRMTRPTPARARSATRAHPRVPADLQAQDAGKSSSKRRSAVAAQREGAVEP